MSELATLGLARAQDAREIAEMSRDLIEKGLTWSWTPARVQHFISGAESSVVVARRERGNARTLTTFMNISKGGKFGLAAGVDQPTASIPTYITAGDLDGAGLPNLVSGWNANSAGIADLNGDGKADLGFGRNSSGLVSLWQNNYPGSGALSFTPTVDMNVASGDNWYYTSDLDGDSKPDLVLVNPGQNTVSIFRNTIGDPVITSFTPDTAYKGTQIKITGRNFTNVTGVWFGVVPADSVHAISTTELDAWVGPGASGSVTVNTLFGTGSRSGFVFIPQIIPQGDTIFCRGNSVALRSTAAFNNQWFKDGIAIGGDTTLLAADSGGSYTVQTTSDSIATVSSMQKLIVKTVPVPVITADAGNTLTSSALTGNQWFYNSYWILDTSRIIRPGPVGTYSVTATEDGCTSDPSALYYWGGAESIQLPDDQYIRYFPNPATNYLVVEEHFNNQPVMVDISFLDDRGNTLLVIRQTAGATIDISSLPSGFIYMHVHADGATKVDKTVKILKIN